MNSAALVALSLIAGVFLVILIAAMALIIVLMIRLQRMTERFAQVVQNTELEHEKRLDAFLVQFNSSCDDFAAEQYAFDEERGRVISGLQSSMAQFRNETRETLKSHRETMDDKLAALNAPALLSASSQITAAAKQLAQTAAAVQSLLLVQEDRDNSESGIQDESYAPDQSSYYSQGATAYSDDRAEREGDQAEQEGPATQLPSEERLFA